MTKKANKPEFENHLDEQEARWFAVYTRPKGEKMAFRYLTQKNITAYLPLQKLIRHYPSKKKIVELPLITCYIFVKIMKRDYVRVLETENVLNFVKFNRNLIAIPEEEIDIMKRVLGEGWEVEANPMDFTEGDEVEIITGRLLGLRGKLIEAANKTQFVVELENLGYSLRMNVDKSLLQKVQKLPIV